MPSPLDVSKRALVALLRTLGAAFGCPVTVTRESSEQQVQQALQQDQAVLEVGAVERVAELVQQVDLLQQELHGQQQEHQRFLEDPLDDGDGQTFSL